MSGRPLTVAVVASCSALALLMRLEKYAITGMPTPYVVPSEFSSLMCTGAAGGRVGFVLDGAADEELDEPPEAEALFAPALLLPAPVPDELQAVATSATAASAAAVDHRNFEGRVIDTRPR